MKKKTICIILTAACLCMALVDAVLRPGYGLKSALKLSLFLILPWIFCYRRDKNALKALFSLKKVGIWPLFLGAGVYLGILGLYFVARNFFDFSGVDGALQKDLGVNAGNFVWVSLYISFVNSLLEEFFFRGFGFLTLKTVSSRRFAGLFSAALFALYHVAMMIGWFHWSLVALLIFGLVLAGLLFQALDERSGTLYPSWLVHMFANFAINTVGFLLLGI